jgi:general secretion pathway protein J
MPRRKIVAASQGFTLVELLVALTLMALMSLILFGGVRFGIRAWEAGGAHIDDASRIETVQSLLRRTISRARFPSQPATAPRFPVFEGSADQLSFIAPLPAHRGIGGSYLFRLATRTENGRTDLLLAWQVFRPDGYAGKANLRDEQTALLKDITAIELSYYGSPGPEDPIQWWSSWEGAYGRPAMVRLRMEFPTGDRRRWPDLIIRVPGF